jgi:hypothetical protein
MDIYQTRCSLNATSRLVPAKNRRKRGTSGKLPHYSYRSFSAESVDLASRPTSVSLRVWTTPSWQELFSRSSVGGAAVCRGRARGRLSRGDDRKGTQRRCAAASTEPVQGENPFRWVRWPQCGRYAVRVAAAQAARSRCASRASRDEDGRCERGVLLHSHRPGPTAVGRRWTPRRCEKGTAPERSAHRGSCGASLKHRARDAGDFWRTCGTDKSRPGSRPGRLKTARC